jgi:hypothetical protein
MSGHVENTRLICTLLGARLSRHLFLSKLNASMGTQSGQVKANGTKTGSNIGVGHSILISFGSPVGINFLHNSQLPESCRFATSIKQHYCFHLPNPLI